MTHSYTWQVAVITQNAPNPRIQQHHAEESPTPLSETNPGAAALRAGFGKPRRNRKFPTKIRVCTGLLSPSVRRKTIYQVDVFALVSELQVFFLTEFAGYFFQYSHQYTSNPTDIMASSCLPIWKKFCPSKLNVVLVPILIDEVD
jgi:hypothetical protein